MPLLHFITLYVYFQMLFKMCYRILTPNPNNNFIGVIKVGYIKTQNHKENLFVLRELPVPTLEYYNSEEVWRQNDLPKKYYLTWDMN